MGQFHRGHASCSTARARLSVVLRRRKDAGEESTLSLCFATLLFLVTKLCPTLVNAGMVTFQAPLPHEFKIGKLVFRFNLR